MPFGPPPPDLPNFRLEPAKRSLRLDDLLTHTGGLQSIFIYNPDFKLPDPEDTLATYVPRLTSLPLDFQPGTRWSYSNAASFDVLARVVEVASGQPVDRFLQDRLFGPLGMTSTAFGDSVDRDRAVPIRPPMADMAAVKGSYHSGAAGLWTTPSDYLAFLRMLLSGGGEVLSTGSIELMTSNRIGALARTLNGRGHEIDGLGFGLGVVTAEDSTAAGLAVADGTFGWDGMAIHRFLVTPSQERLLLMHVSNPTVQDEIEQAVRADLT